MAPRGVNSTRTGGRLLSREDGGQEMHLGAGGGGREMRTKKLCDTKCELIELLMNKMRHSLGIILLLAIERN